MTGIDLQSVPIRRTHATGISGAQIETAVIAAGAALLSLLQTGFSFAIANNVFHLPIVAGLYDEPQYHDDVFIQSLRYFASGIWMLLSNSEKAFGHTELLFLVLAYLSRLLAFVGFLCCASLVGINRRRDKIVFSLVLCFISFLNGYSYGGSGGLFLNYFTHSEIANGTALLTIYLGARGRVAAALTALGMTFFINAFVAVWLVPPLAFIVLVSLAQQKTDWRAISRQMLVGSIPCALLALPVLYNIVSNPDFGRLLDFDFIAYLHQYFAWHMLVDSLPATELATLAAVTILGTVALLRLGAAARELQAAYAGAIFVYAIGVVVPLVTDSRLILNLHLLRSSTTIHLLAGLAIASLATKWLSGDGGRPFFLLGCLLVLLLSATEFSFAFCIPVILGACVIQTSQTPDTGAESVSRYLVLTALLVAIGLPHTWQNHNLSRQYTEGTAEWAQVGAWARSATPPTAMFLIPPGSDNSASSSNPAATSAGFEFASHRRVWVDFKRGAAVLWAPSYYWIWRSRMTEVTRLDTLRQRIDYARRNGIDYVVDGCGATHSQDKQSQDKAPQDEAPQDKSAKDKTSATQAGEDGAVVHVGDLCVFSVGNAGL